MENLLTGLISSKTRINLLVRLFSNPQTRAYLRELAKEFDVSTNAVREELIQLKEAKLLKSEKCGRQIFYQANTDHVLYPELRSMVRKVMGLDQVVDVIVGRLDDLQLAYLIGDYAEGKDSGIIDLILVGFINSIQLDNLKQKTEKFIQRKIRILVLSFSEYSNLENHLKKSPHLLLLKNK